MRCKRLQGFGDMTTSKITRLFLSAGLTLFLGGLLALGCGNSQEAVY